MTNYVIFGLGMMGEIILQDILTNDNQAYIHGIEINAEQITKINVEYNQFSDRFKIHHLSVIDDKQSIIKILNETDVAFGAIDYKLNLRLSELCIQTNTHFLDLGGNPDVVQQQYELDEKAKEANITIIPDCGLAPGMVNIIAANLIREFDEPMECHIRVGGLPKNPKGILQYQQVFSIRGLTNEYIENAVVIRNGIVQEVPSLTELETITFPPPFNELEAFQTAGGTSSLPKLFENDIDELTYKTIRYPDHMKYFKFLSEFNLLSDEPVKGVTPREIVESKLVDHLPRMEEDVVLIRIIVTGVKDGDHILIEWECIDHMDIDRNISAMGRTTSYPISIIGQLIANQTITKRGVQPGEMVVPFSDFIEELAKRQIKFEKNIEPMY